MRPETDPRRYPDRTLARAAAATARLNELEHHADANRASQRLRGNPHVVDVRGPANERAGEVDAEPAIDDSASTRCEPGMKK